MIIGNGLIANAFEEYRNDSSLLIFASGVSKSNEIDKNKFLRERACLKEAVISGLRVVYFSSYSANQPFEYYSPYLNHKIQMEDLVKESRSYLIFRVPQIVGRSKNPSLLLNFLWERIKSQEHFVLWGNCYRSIVDVEDLCKLVTHTIKLKNSTYNNKIISFCNPFTIDIEAIVGIIERICGTKATYTIESRIEEIIYSNLSCEDLISNSGIFFDETYNLNLIKKYYENT
jgi:nucleoside-diphosphate-sugar epimerase